MSGLKQNAFDDIDTMTRTEIIYDDKVRMLFMLKMEKLSLNFVYMVDLK